MEKLESFVAQYSPRQHIVFLFGLALLLCCVVFLKEPTINKDGVLYIHSAQMLYDGDVQGAVKNYANPFYPSLIVLLYIVVGDWVLAARFLSMGAFALTVPILYMLVQQVFQKRHWSFIAALFLAVNPSFHQLSTEILRDPLFLLGLVTTIYLAHQVREKFTWSRLFLLLAAVLFSTLLRNEGAFVFFLLVAYFVGKGFMLLKRQHKLIAVVSVLLLGAAMIPFHKSVSKVTYLMKLRHLENVIKNPQQFYNRLKIHQVREKLKEVEKEFPGGNDKGNLIRVTRNYFPVIYAMGLMDIWIKVAFGTIFILGWIGIIFAFREMFSQAKLLLAFQLLFILIPYGLLIHMNFCSRRYLAGASLLLCAFSGVGLTCFWGWLEQKFDRIRGYGLYALILLALIPACVTLFSKKGEKTLPELVSWQEEKNIAGEDIWINDPRILLYLGLGSEFRPALRKDLPEDANLLNWWKENSEKRYIFLYASKKDVTRYPLAPSGELKGRKKSIFVFDMKEQK